LSFVGLILNVIYFDFFTALGLRERYRIEFIDIGRIGGFQLNPNRLGHLFALVPFANKDILKLSARKFRILLVLSGVAVLLSGGRVSMAMFAIGLIFTYLQAVGRVDYKVLVSLIIAIPFTILLADYGFQELGLFSEPRGDGKFSTSFRVILLSEGFKLAVENFPFGTGLASFGTPFALDVGVYEETGIRGMFFLNQGTALFDNN